MSAPGTSIWKWVAAFLAGALITGAGTWVAYARTVATRADLEAALERRVAPIEDWQKLQNAINQDRENRLSTWEGRIDGTLATLRDEVHQLLVLHLNNP